MPSALNLSADGRPSSETLGAYPFQMALRRRRYSEQTLKRLWGLSGNCCYMTDCREQLAYPDKNGVMGRIAHIRGWGADGPRPVEGLTDKELCAFENLVLLCPNHHTVVDEIDPDAWTIERLEILKRVHEDQRHEVHIDGRELDWVVEFTIVQALVEDAGGAGDRSAEDEWPALEFEDHALGLPAPSSIADGVDLLGTEPTRALLWVAYVYQELEPALRAVLPDDPMIDTQLEKLEICREDDGYHYIRLLLDMAGDHNVVTRHSLSDAAWVLDRAFDAQMGNPPDLADAERARDVLASTAAEIYEAWIARDGALTREDHPGSK